MTVDDSGSPAAAAVVGFAGADLVVGEEMILAASAPDAHFGAGAASRRASRIR